MESYIIAHDLGTSGNKATLFDAKGNLLGSVTNSYETYYPKDGWVEQEAEDWWVAVCKSTQELLEQTKVDASDVAAVSFSAQMMGCLLIDKNGTPLRRMITWADSRSSKQEEFMKRVIGLERGYRITGHRLSASYSAAKLLWVKENEPEVFKNTYKMIHAKDYIVYKLTGKIVTDYSDASGTNLLDLRAKEWSDEILDAIDLDKNLLPDLYPSTHVAGGITASAAIECGLNEGTPVVIGGGDGSCACVGAGVVEEGKAYNVLGTSSWTSFAGKEPIFDEKMRTFNWVHLDPDYYTPCGTMQAAGLSYQWYKNTLCELESRLAKEQGKSVYDLLDEQIKESQPGSNKMVFLPYLIGERSPLWNLNARGAWIGLNATTSKADMTRSVLEGITFNLKIILDVYMESTSIDSIVLIGGGARSSAWNQIIADIWGKEILIPKYIEEATSMGAAICGAVGVGILENFQEARDWNPIQKRVKPNQSHEKVYNQYYSLFKNSYRSLVEVYEELALL